MTFIPFAGHDHAAYLGKVRDRLALMGFDVVERIEDGEAIFIGGGNTFRLLKTLYERKMIDVIRERVRGGVPYIGSSAGSNVAAPTIKTTNDMPIVYPPSFDALNLVPFQINPHYLDPEPDGKHKGETREQRINEFHEENTTPVVGLREGTMLWVENDVVTLHGIARARLFKKGQPAVEIDPSEKISDRL